MNSAWPGMLPSCARAATRIVWVVGEMVLLFRKASAVARETPILFVSRPRPARTNTTPAPSHQECRADCRGGYIRLPGLPQLLVHEKRSETAGSPNL